MTNSGTSKRWMIYGANGYTGRLIAEESCRRSLKPTLAGRNKEAIEQIGKTLDCETKVFQCVTSDEIRSHLEGFSVILNCAGPFSSTSKPIVSACLQAHTHYLDITGEIMVFERILSQCNKFEKAGIVAIPGVGFDVVPTDCLAAMLKESLPTATHLEMGIKISGPPSPGTVNTIIEGLYIGGVIRQDEKLKLVRPAHRTIKISFNGEEETAVSIPWGDVSTAYFSTKIPNIEIFIAASPPAIQLMKATRYVRWVLYPKLIQGFLKKIAQRVNSGPSERLLKSTSYSVWGQVTDSHGKSATLRLKTLNGYELTADAAVSSVERVLDNQVPPGSWTPSQAFGSNYILSLRGVQKVQ